MSEMIDRIAACFAAELMELTHYQRQSFKFPDDCNGDTIERSREAARKAIEAMREPTQNMLDSCDINIPTEGMIIGVWNDMIDAALSERS